MTCLLRPQFASRASGKTFRFLQQQWRPLSISSSPDRASATRSHISATSPASATQAQDNDSERDGLWQEIHSLEVFLGLPQTKSTERWRDKRVRGRARELFGQKIQKTLPGSETMSNASLDAIPSTPLVQQIYETPEEESQASAQSSTRSSKNASTAPNPIKAQHKATNFKADASIRKSSGRAFSKPSAAASVARPPRSKKSMEPWQMQKDALEKKFKDEPWAPKKRLSPDTIEGIRMLHRSDPEAYPTPTLSKQFEVSPEAIRRILKGKWTPGDEEAEDRRLRWERRGEKIWTSKVEMGVRPPKKWRQMGVGRVGPGETPRWKRKSFSGSESVPWDDESSFVEDQGVEHTRLISDQIL